MSRLLISIHTPDLDGKMTISAKTSTLLGAAHLIKAGADTPTIVKLSGRVIWNSKRDSHYSVGGYIYVFELLARRRASLWAEEQAKYEALMAR